MARDRSRTYGIAAIVVAAMLWGSTGTTQALLPADRSPIAVAALRLLIGAASLMVLAWATAPTGPRSARLPVGRITAAGLAIAAYNVLFFAAVSQTGVGVGTALAIGSAPVWATALAFLISGARPSRTALVGQAVSIFGATLLMVSVEPSGGSVTGIAMALLAGGAYAGYSLITSTIGRAHPAATVAASTFSVAALVCLPTLLFVPLTWVWSADVLVLLAVLGIGATGVAYALYTSGLRTVDATTAVTLALIEPLTAWLLATVLLDEPLTAIKLAGALLLALGLAVVTLSGVRPSPVER